MAATTTRSCIHCGKVVHVDIKTCPFCRKPTGSPTPTEPAETAVQTQTRPLRARLGQVFTRTRLSDSGDVVVLLNDIKKNLEAMGEDLTAIRRKLDNTHF